MSRYECECVAFNIIVYLHCLHLCATHKHSRQHTLTHTHTQSLLRCTRLSNLLADVSDGDIQTTTTIHLLNLHGKQAVQRGERESRAQHTLLLDSIVCQFSLPSSCFPLSPLPFSLSLAGCLLISREMHWKVLLSAVKHCSYCFLFSFFFFFLLLFLLLLFMIYAHRKTHPIAALLNYFA